MNAVLLKEQDARHVAELLREDIAQCSCVIDSDNASEEEAVEAQRSMDKSRAALIRLASYIISNIYEPSRVAHRRRFN